MTCNVTVCIHTKIPDILTWIWSDYKRTSTQRRMNRLANLSIPNNDRQLAWRLMSKENRPFGIIESDQNSKPLHKRQSDIVIWCVYVKLTLAAELKVVLEPEFLSPADNRPQIRDVAMLLCVQAKQRSRKQMTGRACVRTYVNCANALRESRLVISFLMTWAKAFQISLWCVLIDCDKDLISFGNKDDLIPFVHLTDHERHEPGRKTHAIYYEIYLLSKIGKFRLWCGLH